MDDFFKPPHCPGSRYLSMCGNMKSPILSELEKFYNFTQSNKLVINKKKCFVMKFSRSRKFDFPAEITIGGSDILEVKKVHRILGIMVQDDLKWQSQCEEMVRRATSTTWALRRMRALGCRRPRLWTTGSPREGSCWSTAARSGTPG